MDYREGVDDVEHYKMSLDLTRKFTYSILSLTEPNADGVTELEEPDVLPMFMFDMTERAIRVKRISIIPLGHIDGPEVATAIKAANIPAPGEAHKLIAGLMIQDSSVTRNLAEAPVRRFLTTDIIESPDRFLGVPSLGEFHSANENIASLLGFYILNFINMRLEYKKGQLVS